jgi:hypothetical protein
MSWRSPVKRYRSRLLVQGRLVRRFGAFLKGLDLFIGLLLVDGIDLLELAR